MAKGTALATKESAELALAGQAAPDWLKDFEGPKGTELIDANDVAMPRLKLAQSMSPEVKDKKCDEGDIIDCLTGLPFIKKGTSIPAIIVAYSKEYILWRDRKDGGGVMAKAKRVVLPSGQIVFEWDKPNTKFTHKIGGKHEVTWETGKYLVAEQGLDAWGSEFPGNKDSGKAATAHFNYVLMFPTLGYRMAAISLTRTAVKKATALNAQLKQSRYPSYLLVFNLGTVEEVKDENKFANWSFMPAGVVQERELAENLKALHVELQARGITVDLKDDGDDAVRSDEGQPGGF